MKTIATSLPIYDSLIKQYFERGKAGGETSPVPIPCPRHRLPSFQWKDETDGATIVKRIDMIGTSGTPNLITGWINTNFDTFVTSGANITSAIAVGNRTALTKQFTVVKGVRYTLTINITVNAGGAPDMHTAGFSGQLWPPQNQLIAGINTINFYCSDSGPIQLQIYGDGGDNFSATVSLTGTDVTDRYFVVGTGTSIPSPVTNAGYDTFTIAATNNITSAIKTTAGDVDYCYSNPFSVTIGDIMRITFTLDLLSGTAPVCVLVDSGGVDKSNVVQLVHGVNHVMLISTVTDANCRIRFRNGAGQVCSYSMIFSIGWFMQNLPVLHDDYFMYSGETLFELLQTGMYYMKITMDNDEVYYSDWFLVDCVYGTDTGLPPTATFSTDYVIIDFHNDCDLGDILYHSGFTQTLYIKSEAMEPLFPLEEEGSKNGEGRFVRTFARQTKKYILRTPKLPAFMLDVLHRLMLHDNITLTDLVGDVHDIYNLEVEHEFLGSDKYYAIAELTFDYDETFVIAGCCNNLT